MKITKVKTNLYHGAAQPPGTDVVMCGIYDSNSLGLLDFSLLDVSHFDYVHFIASFSFNFEWPENTGINVGLSLYSGSRTNVYGYFADEEGSRLGGAILDVVGWTEQVFQRENHFVIEIYTEHDRVAYVDDIYDPPDELAMGLSRSYIVAFKLPGSKYSVTIGEPILPEQAILPNPGDGSLVVPSLDTLRWSSGGYTLNYHVYFGTPGNLSRVSTGQEGTSYAGISLDPSTEYAWRIDSININGVTTGQEWTFTTQASFDPPAYAGGNTLALKERLVAAAKNRFYYENI